MVSLSRDLVFIILKFLYEQKFMDAAHKLEKESGLYFNMSYFEEEFLNGNWDEVERYLSGFTKVGDNLHSRKIFFEIRKFKYFEALNKKDRTNAVKILEEDLQVFASFNEDLYKELKRLLTLKNIRENKQLSHYGDPSARQPLIVELKKVIKTNPLLREKLQFPYIKESRLKTLLSQSLNFQHHLCETPRQDPEFRTFFVDHTCSQPNGAHHPSHALLLWSILEAQGFQPLTVHPPFQDTPTPVLTNPVTFPQNHNLTIQTTEGLPKTVPRTANNLLLGSMLKARGFESLTAHSPFQATPTPVPPTNPVAFSQKYKLTMHIIKELPKTVARTLSQGSNPTSMDFHPVRQTVLLVGTNVGDIALWDVGTREMLVLKNFKSSLVKDPILSINRLIWSPDGKLFGVAYSRDIVQVYSYDGDHDVKQHLELDAHLGGVNDIAFAHPDKQLCIITCGDDKTVKVWDANKGSKKYTFEEHKAPVHSICPHEKDNIQFIISTSKDGKLKAWCYDNLGSWLDFDVLFHVSMVMAYSADGSRLFSCGTNEEGKTILAEWNESEASVKKIYQGFPKRSFGVVQFDTTRNLFLAAGDKYSVLFWNMDHTNLLASVNAEGYLSACPRLRFNKEGSLLAVSTQDNGIKILANANGLRMLRTFENNSCDPSSAVMETVTKNGGNKNLVDVRPRINDEAIVKSNIWKVKICTLNQCRSLRLVDNLGTSKISRLIYTNSGFAILALASNAIHLLWRWHSTERNPSGKASASEAPQLQQSGILMTNDITDTKPKEAVPCFALSNNDFYVASSSGGKISLFNLTTFKTMMTFIASPAAATSIVFHPWDNNIVAIGLEDSTIQIYNLQLNELIFKLRGHSKRVTGLAFSTTLNVLVSSGADAQLCVWGTDGWEKQRSRVLWMLPVCFLSHMSDTRVQFHQDQIHFLSVHESQIAIYEATMLECIKQWVSPLSFAPITHAAFSCDCQLIYASFLDATVLIFNASSLILQCLIFPAAYLPADARNVFPLDIATHPSEPNQFALGLSDGTVHVIEPLESEGKWGDSPPKMS